MKAPKKVDELLKPAVEGTEKVLNACIKNGVKKVVVTSSVAAIMDIDSGKVHNEDDWAVLENCQPYVKSKALAERALWKVKAFHYSHFDPNILL